MRLDRLVKLEKRLGDYADFEEFYAAFVGQMRHALNVQARCLDIYCEEMARCRPAFLQSSMIADCLERGRSRGLVARRQCLFDLSDRSPDLAAPCPVDGRALGSGPHPLFR